MGIKKATTAIVAPFLFQLAHHLLQLAEDVFPVGSGQVRRPYTLEQGFTLLDKRFAPLKGRIGYVPRRRLAMGHVDDLREGTRKTRCPDLMIILMSCQEKTLRVKYTNLLKNGFIVIPTMRWSRGNR